SCWLGRCRSRSGRSSASCRSADRADGFADSNNLAIFLSDTGDNAVAVGANLDIYFIRFKLQKDVALIDGVPFLHEPLRNRAFRDRFSQFWNDNFCHDYITPLPDSIRMVDHSKRMK